MAGGGEVEQLGGKGSKAGPDQAAEQRRPDPPAEKAEERPHWTKDDQPGQDAGNQPDGAAGRGGENPRHDPEPAPEERHGGEALAERAVPGKGKNRRAGWLRHSSRISVQGPGEEARAE